jgi:hypothetical protein
LIACSRDLEWLGREIKSIGIAIRRKWYPTLHSHRQVAFVIETDETSAQLVERLRPVLDTDGIENYWCFTPGADIISKNGFLDSFAGHVRTAFTNIRQRNQREYMRKPQWRKPAVERPMENLEGRASIKVNFRPKRKRKPPREPHRPQR